MFFGKNFNILNSKYNLANIDYCNIDFLLYFYYKVYYYFKKIIITRKKFIN